MAHPAERLKITMRLHGLCFTISILVSACGSSEITTPEPSAAPMGRPLLSQDGEGTSSNPIGTYECPLLRIQYAQIPGNVYPFHAVGVGRGLYPLLYMSIVGYSGTGLEKGQYAIAGGGPYVSDDGQIAVLSGNVTGWCYYQKISNSGVWNYTGNLSVTDFDGEIIALHNGPPDEENEPDSCDDPLTDEIESTCGPNGTTFTSGGGPRSEFQGTTSGGGHTYCDLIDWYESYDGGITWEYVGSEIIGCWVE